MSVTYQFANFVVATLNANVTAFATSFSLNLSSGALPTQVANGRLLLMIGVGDRRSPTAYELVEATAWSGAVLSSVTRGVGGSSAQAWTAATAWVELRVVSTALDAFSQRAANETFTGLKIFSGGIAEEFDPRAYGGVGDGVADDTAAVTACMNAASAAAIARDAYPASVGMTWLPDVHACYLPGLSTKTGLYTLDGYPLQAGNRVAMDDGIYEAAVGAWSLVTTPTAHQGVRVLNGRVNAGRRMEWYAFGGGWTSWSMLANMSKVRIDRTYRITSQVLAKAGVYVDMTGGCLLRDFGGSYNIPALKFMNQSANHWSILRSKDGGSGIEVAHWSSGFYQPIGRLEAFDESYTVPKVGSVGCAMYRYSYEVDRVATFGFERGQHLDMNDVVARSPFLALAAGKMGVFLQGGNFQGLEIHLDSIGATNSPVTKTGIGLGLGLLNDAEFRVFAGGAIGHIRYLLAHLDGADCLTPLYDGSDVRGTYSWLEGTAMCTNTHIAVQQLSYSDADAVVRLTNVGENTHYDVSLPTRRFAFGKSWDGVLKQWSTDPWIPTLVFQQEKVCAGVTAKVRRGIDAPTLINASPTAGFLTPTIEYIEGGRSYIRRGDGVVVDMSMLRDINGTEIS